MNSSSAHRCSWDSGNIAAEIQNNAVTVTYIRGINLIASDVDGVRTYYLYNAHGDVVNLTDSTATAIKSYDYDAFGVERNIASGDANPFRYCAEYYDKETGELYLRARYYNASIGRLHSKADGNMQIAAIR